MEKQKFLKTEQGSMLPRAHNIALLTSFTLMDHVGVGIVIGPDEMAQNKTGKKNRFSSSLSGGLLVEFWWCF